MTLEQMQILADFKSELRKELAEIIRNELTRIGQLFDGKTPAIPPDYYSCRKVAERFSIKDIETVRRWCKEGLIAAEKNEYSGAWEIPRDEYVRLEKCDGNPRGGETSLAV